MARINLLPWRAERRKQRQREFQGMLGMAALAGVLLSFLIWFYYDRQIAGQQDRNAFLKEEIAKVEKQNEEIKELDAKKDRLLARKKVIEELQANRSQMVHLFDSLVRTIPDGVTLNSIKQEGEVLTLRGSAQSNARVSTYMRNLEVSGWMTKPDLSIIEVKKEERKASVTSASRTLPYTFSLKVQLANPNATTAEGEVPATIEPTADVASGDAAAAVEAAPAAAPAAEAAPAAAPAAPAPATAPASPPADTTTQPQQPAAQTEGRPAS
ncbi:PilN domain-containing protein [Pseudoxanthomonas sp. 10H]|uniref:PilN domain-containing protein n=1 Tax=Pseudoxanthomonas sp. 10H TaxID=3242729 RepID=UPI003558320F